MELHPSRLFVAAGFSYCLGLYWQTPLPAATGLYRVRETEMSASDVENLEADQGGENEGSSPSEKEAGLIREIQAQRQTISTLKVDKAEMKGKLDGLSAKTEPVREFTRAELQAQVDDGRMTPDESDRILDGQTERRIEEKVSHRIESAAQTKTHATAMQTEIGRYTSARPDIMVDGTEDRSLVAAELTRQIVELGRPDNVETELTALMAVFGPSNRLQTGREKERQTHQETGSDGGGEGKKETSPKLPDRVKKHYEKMIGMGMYSGWDDERLKEEIDPAGHGARWAS